MSLVTTAHEESTKSAAHQMHSAFHAATCKHRPEPSFQSNLHGSAFSSKNSLIADTTGAFSTDNRRKKQLQRQPSSKKGSATQSCCPLRRKKSLGRTCCPDQRSGAIMMLRMTSGKLMKHALITGCEASHGQQCCISFHMSGVCAIYRSSSCILDCFAVLQSTMLACW